MSNDTEVETARIASPAEQLTEAAVEIFSQAKDVYFRESSILSAKRAELERAESMVVTLRGQIAERESLIGGLKEHMQETFAFARAEMERTPSDHRKPHDHRVHRGADRGG